MPSGWWSPPKLSASPSIRACSLATTPGRDAPSTTGVIIWRCCSASRGHCATARRSPTLPEAFRRLQAVLLKRPGGDREMVDILALVLHHDEQAVLCAVELALESGIASKQHVLNLLSRLVEPLPPPPMDTPAGLRLSDEPQADVHRYDRLRENRHAR